MRFGFVTCVQLGLDCLEEIVRQGGRIDLAITLSDGIARNKSGRVYIDSHCAAHGIPLLKVRHIDEPAAIAAVAQRQIDWLFIVGWSQIAGAELLRTPTRGVLGMHPTLLPEGRGRAAIPWAILKGLTRTGVTLFKLDGGVDSGPIVAQIEVPIEPRETATTLYRRVAEAHRHLIAACWAALNHEHLELRPQDESRASVWPGRRPEDGEIRSSMTVDEADRLVRATTRPYPGAFVRRSTGSVTIWSGSARRSGPDDLPIEVSDGTFWASEHTHRQ